MSFLPQPPVEGAAGALNNWSVLNAMEQRFRGTTPASFAPAGAGTTVMNIRASDPPYGLGVTAVSNAQTAAAIQSFFTALGASFTQSGSDRAGLGMDGEFPAGVYNGSAAGHIILAPVGATRGDIHVYGQTAGGTTLTLPDRGSGQGCMGNAHTLSTSTRSANTFTLGFATGSAGSPLCAQYDVIALKVRSCGVDVWAHYTCTANNVAGDYTKVQYQAFASGMAVDGCIPATGQTVYFPGVFIQPLNFRNPCEIYFHNIEIASGSNTGTPLDGIGLRRSSRCHVDESCRITGWWCNEMINGSPLGGQGAQNTDHSWMAGGVMANASYANTLIISNSSDSYSPNGGGRDNHWINGDFAAPGMYHIVCADDGNIETGNFGGSNFKSGYSVFRGEGVRGVQCAETVMIDGLVGGYFKTESQGNWVYDDESKTRTTWAEEGITHRFEAGLSINGTGNPTNFTYQPYHLTSVTLSTNVMTATITETVHGLTVGDAVQIGNGSNFTTTVASGSNGAVLPQATIHLTTTSGAPTSGQMLILSSTGQQLISYTGVSGNDITGCTLGKGTLATGNSAISQVFNGESRIASFDSTGQIITLPFPGYTGANVTTPGTATMGRIGFMHMGTYDRYDISMDWDNTGNDRYVQGGSYFDLISLRPGIIRMSQDDVASAPRKTLPTFRVRDAEPIGGILGVTTTGSGNRFASTEVQFNQLDIGKTITCVNVNGGADTIASFVDVNTVLMTGAVTAGSGLTWLMSDKQSLDDPRVRIQRGANEWTVAFHSGADANAVIAGNPVEQVTSTGGTMKTIRSAASRVRRVMGFAMTGCPATPGRVSVTTNGLTGTTGRVLLNSPTYLISRVGTVLTLGDDLAQPIAGGSIAAGSLAVDNGDGTIVQVALTTGIPTAGQLVLGQVIKAATVGNPVGIRTCEPYWTA